MSELVVPLVLFALLLVVGAVIGVVVLRQRSPRPPAPTGSAGPDRAPRLRADLGTELVRPEQLGIRTLTAPERERYVSAWHGVQQRAEGRPALALSEADVVVERLLRELGYPVDDPRAPGDVVPGRLARVLADFQAGHALEQVNSSRRSDREQVRRAMAHFRAAFDAVLAEGSPAFPDAPKVLSGERTSTPRPHPGR